MKLRFGFSALMVVAGVSLASAQTDTVESHVNAARKAAGGDFGGVLGAICPADRSTIAAIGAARRPRPPGTPSVPDRASWYAKPYKVFDNLYWVGTKVHSSWALKTSAGIILIDTLYDYAIQPEIVDGLKALKLDPRQVKYVVISHAHGDHDQGAALLQSRYGTRVVMGAADWDATLKRDASYAGGVPKRGPNDISVGPEGAKITLGDTTVNVISTPGHTPGTLSLTFPVKDHGRALTVAYSGGTAFNFPRTAENFAMYEATQKKMGDAAAAAGATVLMSNHTEFDGAYDKVRLAQLPRAAGEAHPYEIGAPAIRRYFEMTSDCAEAQRLGMK